MPAKSDPRHDAADSEYFYRRSLNVRGSAAGRRRRRHRRGWRRSTSRGCISSALRSSRGMALLPDRGTNLAGIRTPGG